MAAAPGDTRLADAARQNDRAAVQALLKQGADVNAAQADGMTALHWAAMNGDVALAQMLLYARRERERLDAHRLADPARPGRADRPCRGGRRAAEERRQSQCRRRARDDAADVRGRLGQRGGGDRPAERRRRREREGGGAERDRAHVCRRGRAGERRARAAGAPRGLAGDQPGVRLGRAAEDRPAAARLRAGAGRRRGGREGRRGAARGRAAGRRGPDTEQDAGRAGRPRDRCATSIWSARRAASPR